MDVLQEARDLYDFYQRNIENKSYDVSPYYKSINDYLFLSRYLKDRMAKSQDDTKILYEALFANKYNIPNIAYQEEISRKKKIPKTKVINFYKNIKKRHINKIQEQVNSDLKESFDRAMNQPLEVSSMMKMLSTYMMQDTLDDTPTSSPIIRNKNIDESLNEGSIITFILPQEPSSEF